MKGIVLAGGSGSRLHPTTLAISKHLLPVFDKPCIYYPLSTLMLAEIRQILIIVNERDIDAYKAVLGDGSRFGLELEYKIQYNPNGIAEALILSENFLNGEDLVLILGDNIFYGDELKSLLLASKNFQGLGQIFSYHVADPERFGVVEIDDNGHATTIEEKPKKPKSSLAVTGLYYYRNQVIDMAKDLAPSERGELEITDVNKKILSCQQLTVERLGRGIAWLDIGTPAAMLEASQFINTIQKRQGQYIACLEEIALANGWIDLQTLLENTKNMPSCLYTNYIHKLLINGDYT